MEKETVVLIRDTIFKKITYWNKFTQKREPAPMVVRLDNDVAIDSTQSSIIWDDANQIGYYFGNNSKYNRFIMIGDENVKFPAMLSAFDYAQIQEMFVILNDDAFGQAVAALNAGASGAKPTHQDQSQPVTEDQYKQIWQAYIKSGNAKYTNDQYKIEAEVAFADKEGTVYDKYTMRAHYTGEKIQLPEPSEIGLTGTKWNTAPDGSGRSYVPGFRLTPTSKKLVLYAVSE